MATAAHPKSKLFSSVEYNLPHIRTTAIDRKYWSETTGLDYIQHLAFKQDVEAIKVSVGGNFYATCCIAAVCFLSFLVFSPLLSLLLGAQIHRARSFFFFLFPLSSYQI